MSSHSRVLSYHFMLAVGENGEFGYMDGLPWPRIRTDMKHFADVTGTTVDWQKRNAVVMGRKTWDSINRRSLAGRAMIVLTGDRTIESNADVTVVHSIDECYAWCDSQADKIESVFIVGGKEIFDAFIADDQQRHRLSCLYITYIKGQFPKADTLLDIQKFERIFPSVIYRMAHVDDATGIHLHFVLRR